MPRPFLLFAIAAALGVTPALAALPLDGWGAYKFGLSPDAARAVPGQVFGPFNPKNLWNENKGAMGAKKPSLLFGQPWALNLFFDSREKLNGISLENEKKSSRDACEKTFLGTLAQMDKSYGGFAPVNPERKRVETDKPPTSLEWRAQGGSRYQFAAVSFEDEYAFVWKARKVVNGNYVDVDTTWASKPDDPAAPCITGINYGGR